MWGWEQGRLEYFQFDELRKIAKFSVLNNIRTADRETLSEATGLSFFPDNVSYPPWRNYSRVFQLAMLVVPTASGSGTEFTEVCRALSQDGEVTIDDYMHFLVQATTDPSPALSDWNFKAEHRYPLLFALKYLLTRVREGENATKISEVIEAYSSSSLKGDEDEFAFLSLIDS